MKVIRFKYIKFLVLFISILFCFTACSNSTSIDTPSNDSEESKTEIKEEISTAIEESDELKSTATPRSETEQKQNNSDESSEQTDVVEKKNLQKYTHQGFYGFDTVTRIIGYEESEEDFSKRVDWITQRLLDYHELFTSFTEVEGLLNVYEINQKAAKERLKVDEDIYNLLEFSLQIAEESEGSFNPCIGTVSNLWRAAMSEANANPEEAALPEAKDLEEAAKHISYQKLKLYPENRELSFEDEILQLDVGAIAKGYALELVMREMEEAGISHYTISIGGNVKALGAKPPGEPWKIGIQDPFDADDILGALEIKHKSVVTSGIYERFFTYEGERYHHIIDPDTLYPSKYYSSVTIIVEDSGVADALSTALFNMDREAGEALAKKYGADVIWVTNDGEVFKSTDFPYKID